MLTLIVLGVTLFIHTTDLCQICFLQMTSETGHGRGSSKLETYVGHQRTYSAVAMHDILFFYMY